MKLYKFRSLADDNDYLRLKTIIETWFFRCSKFKELNDPMEGVFLAIWEKLIKEVYDEKIKRKICSFSGEKWFKNPAMRWYYANSFKWVVIEIDVEEEKTWIKPIMYENSTIEKSSVEDILMTKTKSREHENEYRFLTRSAKNFHKIWKIVAIYFGDPYHHIANKSTIIENNKGIEKYNELKGKIIPILAEYQNKERIETFNIFAENGTIEIVP